MNFQWMTTLFKNRDFLLGRRRNRGTMWVSLLGVGISLAALLLRRNGNQNNVLQNAMKNFTKQNNLQQTALTNEFSNELKPDQQAFNNKNN
ncbi:hypothetical protein MOB87_17490 [Bacillus sonorensis]|uniref:hypothetical protein n=1 Tax=Bacillus sonorensis TaxID=119858 RepID=UPI001F3A460C|nr:hypothetical protein [Bacillus sonorensis]MCF7618259.1 hypothetical protein [Bacillus sonorensis]MCY8089426.1 hypothetical protein [Bacillus sonorensis]